MKSKSLCQLIEGAEAVNRMPEQLNGILDRKKSGLDRMLKALKGTHDLFGIYNTVVGTALFAGENELRYACKCATKKLAAWSDRLVNLSNKCYSYRNLIKARFANEGISEEEFKKHDFYTTLDSVVCAVNEKLDILAKNLRDERLAVKSEADSADKTTIDGINLLGCMQDYVAEIHNAYVKLNKVRKNAFEKEVADMAKTIELLKKFKTNYEKLVLERMKKVMNFSVGFTKNLRQYSFSWNGSLEAYDSNVDGFFKLYAEYRKIYSWNKDRTLSIKFKIADRLVDSNLEMMASLFLPFAITLSEENVSARPDYAGKLKTLFAVYQAINSIPGESVPAHDPKTGDFVIEPKQRIDWPEFLEKPAVEVKK